MDHFSKTCKMQSQLSDIDNLQFSSYFGKKQIELSYLVTLCDLVTAFVENQSTVRPWDARFLGNEKTSAAQKCVT